MHRVSPPGRGTARAPTAGEGERTAVPQAGVGFNGGVPPTFIGTDAPDAATLAQALGAGPTAVCPAGPAAPAWDWDWAGTLAGWRRHVEALPVADHLVVCTWRDVTPGTPLLELDPARWRREVEWPTALWFSTLAVATGRCRDGGAVVVVTDRPATLDAAGQSAVLTVGEGLVNLVRSLAAREGGRGVRVNAVLSARPTPAHGRPGSPLPLATVPGRVDVEVAGAVRLLLADDAAGVTGVALAATGGRP